MKDRQRSRLMTAEIDARQAESFLERKKYAHVVKCMQGSADHQRSVAINSCVAGGNVAGLLRRQVLPIVQLALRSGRLMFHR
jgi:hypothetical protein